MKRAAFLLFAMLIAFAFNAQAAQVSDVKIRRNDTQTRFELFLDAAVPYRAFTLNNPARIVIDLPNMAWRAPANKGDRNRIIKSYRTGVYHGDTLRIVLDLYRPAVIAKHARSALERGKVWQYVFDLKTVDPVTFQKSVNTLITGGGATDAASQNKTDVKTPLYLSTTHKTDAPPTLEVDPKPTLVAKSPVRRKLIVIDAGHGGVDPGARAVTGVYEKTITMAVAQKVKKYLEQTGRYRVKLTRDRDTYIKLPERVAIARRASADLFVSLHADTIGRSMVHGASVYTLSDVASDAESAKLAARENAVDTLVNVDVGDVDKDVADILIDLVTRDTMNQSKTLAETVVRIFKSNGLTTLPERPHRSAGFAVLKAPDIPSVLIEMGYLSNTQEARNLSNDVHRDKIARAVVATIETFFNQ